MVQWHFLIVHIISAKIVFLGANHDLWACLNAALQNVPFVPFTDRTLSYEGEREPSVSARRRSCHLNVCRAPARTGLDG
jgi:hypothetical protein